MNTDDFEQKLQRQTPRQIPAEWRAEILAAVRATAPSHHASRSAQQGFLSTIKHQLSALLWPHPKAWAGLAAVWMVIWAMGFYSVDPTITVAGQDVPPSRELMIALRQQRRELARLIEPGAAPDAEAPKAFRPSPRSERRDEMLAA